MESRSVTTREAIHWVYQSWMAQKSHALKGRDRDVRHPEWTSRILDELQRPDMGAYNIAVTGSKGKGSHAILLAAMLEQCGFRVGLFTGPHLVDFMERFRINGQMIEEPRFIQYMTDVKSIVDRLPIPSDQYMGPVGILAAVAALWFRDEKTDVNIYELGRGALHDDVNRIFHQGALLAPVFLEHESQLGPTLEDVAREKAGVVTDETRWIVTQAQYPSVQSILAKHVCGVTCRIEGQDFRADERQKEDATEYRVMRQDGTEGRVLLAKSGGFWAKNVASSWDAAVQAWCDLQGDKPFPPLLDLTHLRLRGRMDVVGHSPLTLVDGTIHEDSAKYVLDWVCQQQSRGTIERAGAIVGVPSDKDALGVISTLASRLAWLILTRAHNPNLQFSTNLLTEAQRHVSDVSEAPYLEDALRVAGERLRDTDALLILGTQSFVGDAMATLRIPTGSIWSTGARMGESMS